MVTGIVSRVLDDKISIMLNRDDPPDWLDEGKIGLNLLFDESTYDEMERTLEKLIENKDEEVERFIEIFHGELEPIFEGQSEKNFFHLNQSQNNAVARILSARDISLVHGPPGTGKTTTVVQSIAAELENEKQVLVCAPSNAAVDIIVEKLDELNINVLRLGHPARVTDKVINHTLDVQLSQHQDSKMLKDIRKKAEELRRLGKQYKRRFGKAEAHQRKLLLRESSKLKDEAIQLEDYMIYDIINQASVIACTLIGANNQYLFKRRFNSLFIDESSQALEPASWIPILKSKKVVFAGDHLQLPPTVKSKEAEKGGLGVTLFEKVIQKHDVSTLLDTQYRMQPQIMKFSNHYFYEGQLQTADSVLQRKILFDSPVEFIDTAGCGFEDKLNPETLSTYNTEEANFVVKYLEGVLKEKVFDHKLNIGIIAPYKAQTEQLRKIFSESEVRTIDTVRVDINTVDAFQGQERDVILISLTRSNEKGEIGFLADERRMNVAMTRAKYKLVLVGDSATLSNNPFFDELINHFQKENHYKSAFEYLYLE
jgi:superfamily I DNA and/or RNA helicase